MTIKQNYKVYLSNTNNHELTIQLGPTDFAYTFEGFGHKTWRPLINRLKRQKILYFDLLKFCVKHYPCRTKTNTGLWMDGYYRNMDIGKSPYSDGSLAGWNRCKNVY
jgi:hypothetical protein